MRNKILLVILCSSLLVLFTGFSLTTWKMFEFRARLHKFTDNGKWEQTCRDHGLYDETKIVFFGDSQIALWWMAPSFGTLPIINRGISGDWASKAIGRFEKDVIEEQPEILVILIGTNDLRHGQTPDKVINSIEYMVKEATSRKIKTILCSLLPVSGKYTKNYKSADLKSINRRVENLSRRYRTDYVDFYTHLIDEDGLFKDKFTSDGLHPSKSGYYKMSVVIFPYLMKNYLGLTHSL